MFTQYNFLSYKSALICRVNNRTFICQISLYPAVPMCLSIQNKKKMGAKIGMDHEVYNIHYIKTFSVVRCNNRHYCKKFRNIAILGQNFLQ